MENEGEENHQEPFLLAVSDSESVPLSETEERHIGVFYHDQSFQFNNGKILTFFRPIKRGCEKHHDILYRKRDIHGLFFAPRTYNN